MSLLFTSEGGWIVSHLRYVNEMYEQVSNGNGFCALAFNEMLFDINSQYLRQNQIAQTDTEDTVVLHGKRKRKRSRLLPQEDLEEVSRVEKAFASMMSAAKAKRIFSEADVISDNNKAARLASQKFYQDTYCIRDENLYGSNDTNDAIISEAHDKKYVFPRKCTFYCYDVRDMEKKMDLNNQYDFILLDPPWWNKSIRRKKMKCAEASYKMMYNEELIKIPIGKLLRSNGIVAVWCTNSSNNLNSIFNEIFPSWGITYTAKWYWVKVTQAGNTICNFNSAPGKQPFELLVLGSTLKREKFAIPDGKLIISVPSAVHSHKPPLTEIIKEYLPDEPKCLEIFARYLLPGWTSWGLEILKFQHLSLYKILRGAQIINGNDTDCKAKSEKDKDEIS
ncbi:hypothetical protein DMN91_005402 [Ooceraea biroi]|uniref:Methyltransferase-like protein n=1 Tax=Ooceraea biroi TaxID=2015173 RepID=A0A026X1F7_OOCBI|nr:methyltransferase-like protein 4 [Ooceraea biroi]EZA61219.1 Methyltransferase-like protein [Ooceraea biroi]RLU23124.1 hypothetical protein DMN91_005402 [Ooceraea biroi]